MVQITWLLGFLSLSDISTSSFSPSSFLAPASVLVPNLKYCSYHFIVFFQLEPTGSHLPLPKAYRVIFLNTRDSSPEAFGISR